MYWYHKFYDENREMRFANGYTQESLEEFLIKAKLRKWIIKRNKR